MNKLTPPRRGQILGMMAEGVSIRAICRMTGVSKNTVAKLLKDAGTAFAEYQDKTFRNLKARRIQCDEIWSFVWMKEKTAKRKGSERPANVGDTWTWTAIDADTKLVPSWFVGERDAGAAYEFISDLESRLANRVQLTTDGHRAYLDAVESTFGYRGIDYAMLVKLYGPDPQEDEKRYSPAKCIGCEQHKIFGNPDPDHISTSYVERQNLSMRMGMRRFTRLTNAFSKKLENHIYAISIYFMHYNFVRIHQTLRVTPAMEAKTIGPDGKEKAVTDHLWTLADMVAVLEEWEARQPHEKVGRKLKAEEVVILK
ncbi:MAG: helix-turn-helix domain-containing protein [Candidatus Binatia bacterium]|jgi:IS1 family transposase